MAARYRVQLSFKAQRQLDALPQDKKRIDARLLALADNPRPHGTKGGFAVDHKCAVWGSP